MVVILLCAFITCPAFAGDDADDPADLTSINPIRVMEDASTLMPGSDGDIGSTLNILLLLTVISLAPALLILCTCFTRMVIALSLLRQALGAQGMPPNQVIIGLSLFITLLIMAPTAQRMYEHGLRPYMDGDIECAETAWEQTRQPLRDFMFAQIEATNNWSSVFMMLNYRGIDTSDPASLTRSDVDMLSLIPAYVLSELKVAFLIGFKIFLPFLVIDIVIASMLVSMGMLMVPPVLISLPFKLLLFVLVDGWQLIVGSLMVSVVQPGVT